MSNTHLPNSVKELRQLYNVGSTTWWKWLRHLNIRRHAKRYTPHEKQLIIAHLGEP